MSSNRIIVGAVVAAACLGVAFACGPNFPWQLLDNRDQAVADPVGLGFNFEASRLVAAPRDRLQLVEPRDPTGGNYDDKSTPEVVTSERTEAQSDAWQGLMTDASLDAKARLAKLAAARSAGDGEAVLAAGKGLPAAVLDYIAGAVEFRAANFDDALRWFQAIDRLPADQRRLREVAATYMQGRIYQRLGEPAKARAAFQATRRIAGAGAPDPQGLAVTSLGEEALVDLVEAGVSKPEWAIPPLTTDAAARQAMIANAVRLYAEQASRGSKMALLSLREVVRLLLKDAATLRRAAADPLIRRLLVAYVVARDGSTVWEEGPYGPDDEMVVSISEAVVAQPAPAPGPDLDRLAALAYQTGRYELAEKLTLQASGPLGLWIRAKLALRRDDRAAAIKDWLAALGALEQPGTQQAIDSESQTRLRGETAVMKLSQGEYRESLGLLFPVATTFWGDVIYVAERVLTVDELKAFVDALPPAQPVTPPSDDSEWWYRVQPTRELRELLARRLLRVGRIPESVPYFEASSSLKRGRSDGATQDEVRSYLAAVEATRPGSPFDWPWQWVDRAEALFKLSVMTRQRGLQLMGTEGPPDEVALGGSFPSGIGQSSPNGYRDTHSKLLGPDEVRRFAASAPMPDTRYHYRGVAADQALAAADYLPQRSQAYAATLCWAARHAFASADPAKAEAIYRRYVATGAYQPWARNFGRECAEPDFAAARTFWQRRLEAWASHYAGSVQRHAVLVASAAVAAAVLLAVLFRLRRSRRASAG
ncbi:tetratricopeptide repeat protein [Reyranella sp.]|uniref:tetratricopeptide repeat protein n=1 Tax=Reyranella sp. TaxID=1929291 RepID=UPI003D11165C